MPSINVVQALYQQQSPCNVEAPRWAALLACKTSTQPPSHASHSAPKSPSAKTNQPGFFCRHDCYNGCGSGWRTSLRRFTVPMSMTSYLGMMALLIAMMDAHSRRKGKCTPATVHTPCRQCTDGQQCSALAAGSHPLRTCWSLR